MIAVRGVSKRFGSREAVIAADLTLQGASITCLLGPSGCGKSTLLRMIAGLERVDSGEIALTGPDGAVQPLSGGRLHVPPERRPIGLVFQEYALFPHLTVIENVTFGLRHLPRNERASRALALLERVRMADRARSYPQTLSGGEQQRVALARALAREPRAVLLDEPFSGLDGALRSEVRATTLAALRASGSAALIVTHDAEEAMLSADHLALMHEGRILQTGSPAECYGAPASVEAARLLGEINIVPARVHGAVAESVLGRHEAPAMADGPARIGVRPEAILAGEGGIQATVTAVGFAGGFYRLSVVAGGETLILRRALSPGAEHPPSPGDSIGITVAPAAVHLFEA
ncbi:MAG: ABC transporter ATP-binding protein [Brevundimonas sp.]|jgi:iron(III) transport system ATP-binding protein|uniref:ABC transporter ATP-binding protein n=1 Tax=Brevundimonas sp. TaxID=1871086 RepID=UPI00391C2029